MADQTPKEPPPPPPPPPGGGGAAAPYATRVDPVKSEGLTDEQRRFIRLVELEQWKKKAPALRTRNVLTGLAIGAVVVGIYGYTFFSVSQERIMDDLDEEAKLARMRAPKTGAN